VKRETKKRKEINAGDVTSLRGWGTMGGEIHVLKCVKKIDINYS
jgi:hypothetical protein